MTTGVNNLRQPFSLYKRSNGVWYYATYSRSGRRVYRSTGTTKKTEAYAIAMERFRTDTLIETPEIKLARFRDLAAGFWDYDTCPIVQDKLARGGTYTRRSAQDNARMCEQKILPTFGSSYLCDITPAAIRNWLICLSKDVSAKSVNNALIVLRQMLDEAVFRNLIASNPARNVKPLIHSKKARGCFTREQVSAIVGHCENDALRMIVRLAARTGMRQGEIRALTVEQIKDRFINVDSSWGDIDGRKGTKAGYSRVVPIDPAFRAELLTFAPAPRGLVFTFNGSTPISASWLNLHFTEAMEKAQIDWKADKLCFHSLRHYANTQLLSGGIAPDIVRKIIGHTSETMTENYLHIDADIMNSVNFIQVGEK